MGHARERQWRIIDPKQKTFSHFHSNPMKRDRIFHILRFLHFTCNRNQPDKADEISNRLWKMRTIFDKLSDVYAKCYSVTEHVAVYKAIVLFRVESFSNNIFQRNANALG
jgi:hypothetical protein